MIKDNAIQIKSTTLPGMYEELKQYQDKTPESDYYICVSAKLMYFILRKLLQI